MIPNVIIGATHMLTPPQSLEGVIPNLPVIIFDNGLYLSRWVPNREELEILNQGGSVEVASLGSQAPMSVGVTPLLTFNDDAEFRYEELKA